MFDNFDEWADQRLSGLPAASLVVAVAEHGETVFGAARGWADHATSRLATLDTPYLLASVTKSLTSVALLRAAQRVDLSLDEPVANWSDVLPLEASVRGRGPTIRQLLRHTSGLPTYFDFFYDGIDSKRTFRETASQYGLLESKPGEIFRYSNLGFAYVDALSEAALGRTTARLIEDEIFAPLAFSSGHVGPLYPSPELPAVRYSASGLAYPNYDTTHRGASLAWGSALDLLRFAESLRVHGRSLDEAETADLLAVDQAAPSYGLGVRISHSRRGAAFGHFGSMGGCASAIFTAPKLGVSAVALSNSTAGEAAVREAMAAIFGGDVGNSPDRRSADGTELDPYCGSWHGTVWSKHGGIPAALMIARATGIQISIASGPFIPVLASPREAGAVIAGSARLTLPTADALVRSPRVQISLRTVDVDQLSGTVAASSAGEGEGSPWIGNHLPYRAQFRRST